jgi:hypothetical protein
MADFQISLTNPSGVVSITASNGVMVVGDYSNYIASTESGHLLADFSSYKKLYVVDPGDTLYEFSTFAGADELINPPSTYVSTPVTHSLTYSDDGVYEVTLVSVPTFSLIATYQSGDCVYHNGDLYEATTTTTGSVPTLLVDWDLIPEEDLPDKYYVVQHAAVIDSIEECFATLLVEANAAITTIPETGEDICSDDRWRRAARLDDIIQALPYFANNGEWEKVSGLISKAHEICDCQ